MLWIDITVEKDSNIVDIPSDYLDTKVINANFFSTFLCLRIFFKVGNTSTHIRYF